MHYVEGHDEPDLEPDLEVLDESWDVRCPECGSRVRELDDAE